jgi:hypothetical protein
MNRARQTAESGFDSELPSQIAKEHPDSVELIARAFRRGFKTWP